MPTLPLDRILLDELPLHLLGVVLKQILKRIADGHLIVMTVLLELCEFSEVVEDGFVVGFKFEHLCRLL